MGTRSDIIVQLKDGRYARIYCHWDGYLKHNGQILFEHYRTQEKVEALIALGDISVLNPEIGVKHPFDPPPMYVGRSTEPTKEYREYEKKYGNMCRAYGRDRGEKGTQAKVLKTLDGIWPKKDSWTEFTYVWRRTQSQEGQWWVGDPAAGPGSLVLLEDALSGEKEITPAVKAFGQIIGQHAPINSEEKAS